MKYQVAVVLLGIFLATIAATCQGSESCLKREWQQLSYAPSESEKSFDELNDTDNKGDRYSCDAYVTPTEVVRFMHLISDAAAKNDIDKLGALVLFPIAIYSEEVAVNVNGELEHNSEVVEDLEEFKSFFSAGLPSSLRSVLVCMSLSNSEIDKVYGISAGFGSIWFNRESTSRALTIRSLGIYPTAQAKWIAENCH